MRNEAHPDDKPHKLEKLRLLLSRAERLRKQNVPTAPPGHLPLQPTLTGATQIVPGSRLPTGVWLRRFHSKVKAIRGQVVP
jgi:hypothetical protein